MKHYNINCGFSPHQSPLSKPKEPSQNDIIPFGRYKGTDVVDVPSSYLRWLCLTDDIDKRYPRLIKAADEELKFRDKRGCHFEEDGGRRG